MDLQAFASLLRRQYMTVVIVTLATILATTTIFFLQPPVKKLTLLFSVGVAAETDGERNFDATKISDDFAKTVAGWMRSPTLAERVSGIAGGIVALSAAPQAKQNFLVEARFGEDGARDITQSIKQVLNDEIEKYNLNSKFKFLTTIHGESLGDSRESLPKALAAAATGGILLAMLGIVLNSYFAGKVNSVREAEKLLKVKAAVIFRNPKKDEVNFLKKLVKKSHQAVLIGADLDVEKLRAKLNLGVKVLEIPKDVEKIGKSETKIVVVKLDKSRSNTLRMLKSVCGENLELVIWA
jgi:hypothetical protein